MFVHWSKISWTWRKMHWFQWKWQKNVASIKGDWSCRLTLLGRGGPTHRFLWDYTKKKKEEFQKCSRKSQCMWRWKYMFHPCTTTAWIRPLMDRELWASCTLMYAPPPPHTHTHLGDGWRSCFHMFTLAPRASMHFFDPKNGLVFYGEDRSRFNICFLLNYFEKER